MRVDRRARVLPRRLVACALLRRPGLQARLQARHLELELAAVLRGELRTLGLERLSGDRAHGSSLLLAASCPDGGPLPRPTWPAVRTPRPSAPRSRPSRTRGRLARAPRGPS